MNKIDTTAKNALRKAGKMILKEFSGFNRNKINFKKHKEIVTRADIGSEKIIISEIRKRFPEHSILSEEKGSFDNGSDYLWIIDPIDGTTNFTMHNPIFSISIGVAYKNKIIAGYIYAPFLKELFIAETGKGARLNGKEIEISKIKGKGALHAFCHGHEESDVMRAVKYYSDQKLKNKAHCRQLGSAAIELAYVASGRLESLTIAGAKPWDVAAGVLLVREAGGMVTDFSGMEWNLDSKDLIASNNLTHKNILRLVSKY